MGCAAQGCRRRAIRAPASSEPTTASWRTFSVRSCTPRWWRASRSSCCTLGCPSWGGCCSGPHGAAVNSASSQHARCGQAAAALARRLHRHPGRHGGVGRQGAPVHRRHRRHLPAAPSLHPLRRAASLHTSACEAGAICCSALFVLVPWDAARLQVLLKMSRAERAVGPSAEEKDNSARS